MEENKMIEKIIPKKTFIQKFWKIIKKPWIIIILIIVVLISVGGVVQKNKPIEYDYITVATSDLVQEVSLTGRVQAAESVDLAFEKSGKVYKTYVKVGDQVKSGQLLASLSNADASAQVSQALANWESSKASLKQYEAALASQQAKLAEYKKGTRPEEIKIAETAVANAEKTLVDAKASLQNVKDKANADLDKVYDTALNTAAASIDDAMEALYTISDIQLAHYNDNTQDGVRIADSKGLAILYLLGQSNAGNWSKEFLYDLNGGAKGLISTANTQLEIDQALIETKNSLDLVKDALNTIPSDTTLTTTEQTNLYTYKTVISAELLTISTQQQTILVQKVTNDKTINTAESTVNEAQNSLISAQDNLKLKQAGYTAEQLAAQEAQVQQAQANVDSQKASIKYYWSSVANYQAQLSKTVIRAPISGKVTKVEVKKGEIASANTNIISLMSEAKYEIEAQIPEVDIAAIKLEDQAQVTLDAYGSDTFFEAKVVEIDPAETIIDGVPSYKVVFQFLEDNDLIKSGMTANLDILTAERKDIISVPQRTVIKQNGHKIVKILEADNSIKEVQVVTGLRGSSGNIEILEGLRVGDKVVLSVKDSKSK